MTCFYFLRGVVTTCCTVAKETLLGLNDLGRLINTPPTEGLKANNQKKCMYGAERSRGPSAAEQVSAVKSFTYSLCGDERQGFELQFSFSPAPWPLLNGNVVHSRSAVEDPPDFFTSTLPLDSMACLPSV